VALFYKLYGVAVEVLFPTAFAAFVLLKRSSPGPFPSWAKGLAIGAALAGLVAAVLHYQALHYRELGMTLGNYMVLMHFWRTLVGVVMGIIISIVVACMRKPRRESREGSA
jgi:peptidoglycan biosynthesis protein MviN/MurJ (putative lipid II flippase)